MISTIGATQCGNRHSRPRVQIEAPRTQKSCPLISIPGTTAAKANA
jgi:hypothetical protein